MVSRRDMAVLALVALASVLVALLESLGGAHTGLLHLAPALILLLPLLAGRYVGESRIAALASSARPRVVRRAPLRVDPRLPRATPALVARGARLLGASLAERGPPVTVPAR
jgi:hypothetical protein